MSYITQFDIVYFVQTKGQLSRRVRRGAKIDLLSTKGSRHYVDNNSSKSFAGKSRDAPRGLVPSLLPRSRSRSSTTQLKLNARQKPLFARWVSKTLNALWTMCAVCFVRSVHRKWWGGAAQLVSHRRETHSVARRWRRNNDYFDCRAFCNLTRRETWFIPFSYLFTHFFYTSSEGFVCAWWYCACLGHMSESDMAVFGSSGDDNPPSLDSSSSHPTNQQQPNSNGALGSSNSNYEDLVDPVERLVRAAHSDIALHRYVHICSS